MRLTWSNITREQVRTHALWYREQMETRKKAKGMVFLNRWGYTGFFIKYCGGSAMRLRTLALSKNDSTLGLFFRWILESLFPLNARIPTAHRVYKRVTYELNWFPMLLLLKLLLSKSTAKHRHHLYNLIQRLLSRLRSGISSHTKFRRPHCNL